MLKILVVSESKTGKQGAKIGQNFHENKSVQNSIQSTEKVKSPIKIMKIKLDVENADGLGVKKNNEKGQTGGKIYIKINVWRIPPNHWKRSSHPQGF